MPLVIEDNFIRNGADHNLSSHVPDVAGTGWSLLFRSASENITVYNEAFGYVGVNGSANSQGIAYASVPDPTEDDLDLTITFGASSLPTSSDDAICPFYRLVDSSNYYTVAIRTNGSGGIYKNLSGTKSLIGSGFSGLTIGSGDVWLISVRGTTHEVYQNGNLRDSATDSSFTSAGKCGIGFGNLAVATDDEIFAYYWTKYQLIEIAASGGGAVLPLMQGPNLGKNLLRGPNL